MCFFNMNPYLPPVRLASVFSCDATWGDTQHVGFIELLPACSAEPNHLSLLPNDALVCDESSTC